MKASTGIRRLPLVVSSLVVLALVALAAVVSSSGPGSATGQGSSSGPGGTNASASASPSLDPGTALHGPAPNFTLTDQFDRPVSLRQFRGKVVLLAFNDSQCTTICPLTTTAMVEAKRMLGASGSKVALLGVDANPRATSVEDVRSYSEVHGMTHAWHFMTTSPTSRLRRVWRAYHVAVEIAAGQIDHTPALFAITPQGNYARLYLTQMSYASVTQQAQILAHEASSLLPGHPAVSSHLSYANIRSISPSQRATLPLAGHGQLALGPGRPRLLLFFASWDSEVMDISRQLDALRGYVSRARRMKLPQLVAVDEGTVEPSPSALPRLLRSLPTPLDYPVAIDRTGQVADGYGVQDEPWMVLVSRTGTPLWFRDISTSGWLSAGALEQQVQAALSSPPTRLSTAAVRAELAGSPAPLAALHARASEVFGSEPALLARIHALHGYPIVVNIWASWCAPCEQEFKLLAAASAHYGRQVAFLGADVNDTLGDARAFLAQHHVSYPSYPVTLDNVTGILPAGLAATPTTIFYNSAGQRTYVHIGQYESLGTLYSDITAHALGG